MSDVKPAVSLEFSFETATRVAAPLKVGVSGVAGAGKTWNSLLIAAELASNPEKVFLIDSENGSAALYSDRVLKGFKHLTLKAPFSPERLMAAVKAADKAGAEVIIIDSISPFWSGPGGILDIHDKLGGEFRTWAKTNTHYNTLKNAIFLNPRHTIVTMRAKSDYVIGEENGRKSVKKVGLKEDFRDMFEFELSCHIRFEHSSHLAAVEKDRTGILPSNGIPFEMTADLTRALGKFARGE